MNQEQPEPNGPQPPDGEKQTSVISATQRDARGQPGRAKVVTSEAPCDSLGR